MTQKCRAQVQVQALVVVVVVVQASRKSAYFQLNHLSPLRPSLCRWRCRRRRPRLGHRRLQGRLIKIRMQLKIETTIWRTHKL